MWHWMWRLTEKVRGGFSLEDWYHSYFLEWSLSLLKDWKQRKQPSSVGRTSFPPTSHRYLIRKLVPRTPTEMRLMPSKTAFLTAVDDIRCYKFLDDSQILSVSHRLLLNYSCVALTISSAQTYLIVSWWLRMTSTIIAALEVGFI